MATAPERPGSDAALAAMLDEIQRADPIYRPSQFWEFHGSGHVEFLSRHGLGSFKRTLNLSYFNWLPRSWDNNQLRNLLALWCRDPDLRPLRARFASRPRLEWVHPGTPLGTDDQWSIHALHVGLLWHYTLRTDRHALLTTLEEPLVGEPFPIELDGKLISQDLANSVREYNVLRDALDAGGLWNERLTLGELGAGYGRLAYVFAKAAPGRYLIFDIPPTLHVAQWYLSRVCPEKRVFAFRPFDTFAEIEAELRESQLAFFTPNQLELFPAEYFTGFISISSLAEMTREQVEQYKQLISDRTSRMVYFKQWRQHYNAHDKLLLDADRYALAAEWATLARRTDAVQDDFVEHLQGRNGFPAPIWATATGGAATGVEERLRKECAEFQRVADDRLDIIRELEVACRERLELINRLEATCHERLAVIEQLEAANRERHQLEKPRARKAA